MSLVVVIDNARTLSVIFLFGTRLAVQFSRRTASFPKRFWEKLEEEEERETSRNLSELKEKQSQKELKKKERQVELKLERERERDRDFWV